MSDTGKKQKDRLTIQTGIFAGLDSKSESGNVFLGAVVVDEINIDGLVLFVSMSCGQIYIRRELTSK